MGVYPVYMALRAVNKGSDEMRLWLFYLVGYVVLTLVWPFIEFVPYAAFSCLALLVGDWYYDAQVLVVIALVFPKKPQLAVLLNLFDTHAKSHIEKLDEIVRAQLDTLAARASKVVQ